MLSFVSRQSNKKISVIELFPVREENKRTPHQIISQHKCVKVFLDHVYNARQTVSQLVALGVKNKVIKYEYQLRKAKTFLCG